MTNPTDIVSGMQDRRNATLPALAILLIAVGVFGFLYLAHEIAEGEYEAIDRAILLALRNPADLATPIGPPWLEQTMLELTGLGGYPIIVTMIVIVLGFLLVAGLRGPALFVLLSTISGLAVSQSLKSFYGRPRPDIVPLLVDVYTASFPSGHAMMSTVVYLTLATVIARITPRHGLRVYVFAVAILLSLVIGLSRVYLGVHWPTDVLAGWAMGAAWAALAWLVVSALRHYRHRHV
jgi:undecaprenyl-diphosphatase